MAVEKKYDPHVIVVWTPCLSGKMRNRKLEAVEDTEVAVQEYSYKEDAEEKYELLIQAGAPKVVLAKVIKAHGEG